MGIIDVGTLTSPIQPVSNWRLLARKAIEEGCQSGGEYLVWLAFSLIKPDAKGVREIMEVFTQWAREREAVDVQHSAN